MKNRLILITLSLLLISAIPVRALEDTAPAEEPTIQQAPPADVGPPESSGGAFHYNPDTGLWENELYTWDPATKETRPKQIDQPISPPLEVPELPPAKTDAGTMSAGDLSSDPAVPLKIEQAHLSEPETNSAESHDSTVVDVFFNALIDNNINAAATSGDSKVHHNTFAGSAQSGVAQVIASVFNMIQSSWSAGNQLLSFITDIFGDVVGDLVLNLDSLEGNASSTNTDGGNVDVTVENNGRIENDINLTATSGDASVRGNTNAGDATTGDAHVVANIINIINSIIAAGESFVGVVNIHGRLEGDILLPPEVLDTILASNGPTEVINTTDIENGVLLADVTTNSHVDNTITATAATGNATVAENTTAGNATTGDANTNLTVMNLTGREVIGDNALLVFVNVLGNWVGMIMDAPAGSTSAALGGGISQNQLIQNGTIDVDTDSEITNNITLNAHSGDAEVVLNTNAGNATTGHATASANVLNIAGNQFSLADWFGILFINVFGSWNGSFGIDTAAGDPPSPPVPVEVTNPAAIQDVQVFGISQDSSSGRLRVSQLGGNKAPDLSDEDTEVALEQPQVLSQDSPEHSPLSEGSFNWLPIIGSLVGIGLLGTERVLRRRS